MASGDIDLPSVPHVPISPRVRPFWARCLAFVAIVPLVGFIAQSARTLWQEWNSLRRDHASVQASDIVGYVNISPNPSYAARPTDWFHEEGGAVVLWSGWRDGQNHWFRCSRGDIDVRFLSLPIGRDVIQAIDVPIFEQGSGPRWDRVPDAAAVVGLEGKGGATSYPLKVLDKVEVINDHTGDRPVLLAFTPVEDVVSIFEATLEGQRVTMGHSGYFIGHRPVLYDRGTESLWSEKEGSMIALTGPRKGSSLKSIGQVRAVAWSDWRAKHPDCRLLVGADRSRQPRRVD